MIVKELNPLDQMSLKITNRLFNELVPCPRGYHLEQAQHILYMRRGRNKQTMPGTNIGMSSTRQSRPYLACMCCSRLRSSLEFDDDNVRREPELDLPRLPKGGKYIARYSSEQRMCIDCRLKEMDYEPLTEIKIEGYDHVVCGCRAGAYTIWRRTVFCMPECCRRRVRAQDDDELEDDESEENEPEDDEPEEDESEDDEP